MRLQRKLDRSWEKVAFFFSWGEMRHRICYIAELHRGNCEWARKVQKCVLYWQKVGHIVIWCILLTQLGLGDTSGMCRHKHSFETCLGFQVEVVFQKTFKQVVGPAVFLLSLSPLLGSTEPQNLGGPCRLLDTPPSLSLAQGRRQQETWYPTKPANELLGNKSIEG